MIFIRNINVMGMALEQWNYNGCVANFGVGDKCTIWTHQLWYAKKR